MKWIAVVLFVVSAQVLLPSEPKPDTQPCGGYQMLTATVTISPGKGAATWDEHRVFMVNSATGETWEYGPPFYNKEGKLTDAAFYPICTYAGDNAKFDFRPERPQSH